MIEVKRYARMPFEVEGLIVTAQNMPEVATWCDGELVEEEVGRWYIKVEVQRVLNERQRRAYIGDWILKAGTGFKVYTGKAFDKSFVEVQGAPVTIIPTPEVVIPSLEHNNAT